MLAERRGSGRAKMPGLTEWPVPLLGQLRPRLPRCAARGDPAHHAHEPEIFRLHATRRASSLQRFVCVANIAAADGGAIDRRGQPTRCSPRACRTRASSGSRTSRSRSRIRRRSSTRSSSTRSSARVADKVERVAKLARWLVETRASSTPMPDQVERAARLAKADLVTGMVGEFPELQGVIGGYHRPRSRRERRRRRRDPRPLQAGRGRATRCPRRPSLWLSLLPTRWTAWSASSSSARSRRARRIRSPCAAPRSGFSV